MALVDSQLGPGPSTCVPRQQMLSPVPLSRARGQAVGRHPGSLLGAQSGRVLLRGVEAATNHPPTHEGLIAWLSRRRKLIVTCTRLPRLRGDYQQSLKSGVMQAMTPFSILGQCLMPIETSVTCQHVAVSLKSDFFQSPLNQSSL